MGVLEVADLHLAIFVVHHIAGDAFRDKVIQLFQLLVARQPRGAGFKVLLGLLLRLGVLANQLLDFRAECVRLGLKRGNLLVDHIAGRAEEIFMPDSRALK